MPIQSEVYCIESEGASYIFGCDPTTVVENARVVFVGGALDTYPALTVPYRQARLYF
jgi:hypothetical protein